GERWLAADRTAESDHGPCTRDRRWGESRVDARGGASGCGGHASCTAPHPGRSDTPGFSTGSRSRIDGVLQRLRGHPAENPITCVLGNVNKAKESCLTRRGSQRGSPQRRELQPRSPCVHVLKFTPLGPPAICHPFASLKGGL